MRLVFMGSPAFAVPALERLLADGHSLPLVVTQPDRPAGRGQSFASPPVKVAATRHGLPLLQPHRLADPPTLATLRAAAPELIVVVAFGQFLPRAIRELPPMGAVNVHASLLPKYRGAAPINWAIIRGERETGVTIMRVEAGMDSGAVLLRRACPILPEDEAGTLHDRLALLGADALAEALSLIARHEDSWRPQDEVEATFAPKIGDRDCQLDLSQSPADLVNRIRGLSPAPGAYLRGASGRRLKVLRAAAADGAGKAGTVICVDGDGLVIGTVGGPGGIPAAGALALLEVQPEGKRRMSGSEYARGRRLVEGMPCI
ncbi:MAG: methionyl-tRNA formyltransferase [candidate division NC10 bacterium]|nr:methionyl-tRNA formyltransferase [candidate division NC10 bacterium]